MTLPREGGDTGDSEKRGPPPLPPFRTGSSGLALLLLCSVSKGVLLELGELLRPLLRLLLGDRVGDGKGAGEKKGTEWRSEDDVDCLPPSPPPPPPPLPLSRPAACRSSTAEAHAGRGGCWPLIIVGGVQSAGCSDSAANGWASPLRGSRGVERAGAWMGNGLSSAAGELTPLLTGSVLSDRRATEPRALQRWVVFRSVRNS